MTKYESTMSEKTDISLPGRIYGILQAESGTPVYWYGTGAGGKFCVKDLLSGEALAEDLALNGNSFAAALATDGTLYIADKDGIYRYEEGLQLLYPLGDDYPFIKYTEWRYPMPVIFVCWWKWTTVRYCLSLKNRTVP